MKFRFVTALAGLVAAAAAAGCVGRVSDEGPPGSGTGAAGGRSTGNPGAGGGGGQSGPGGNTTGAGGSGQGGTVVVGGSGGMVGPPGSLDLSGNPKYYRVVRLTNEQWARSVQDILRLPAPSGLESAFQDAVGGTTDFTNNELVLDVTQRSWGDFQTAAEALADQATASDAALARVYTGTDPAGFINALGRRAYRRPLTSAETSKYMTIYTTGSMMTGTRSAFAKGAALVIRTMLQSPFFLYRTELGANGAALSGYEMASKLSLWLRGTTPSDALLDSAAPGGTGKLDTADGAATLATTMLSEPTATAVMRRFHGGLLHMDRYALISKVGVPTYKEALNDEYQESSYLFFDKLFTQGMGVRQMLTSTSGFMGPGMAALYGLPAPAAGAYLERDLGVERVGYFAQLPYLTLYGLNAEPDSIHRGVSLNIDVLCAQLGPPAAEIPPVPPLVPGQTNRQRISTLTAGCGGSCHNQMINPLGFAFEHFDGMGQYRDTENGGLTIDSAGSYNFLEGVKAFSGAPELMRLMADGQQAHQCYAKKLASFGLQRDIVAADQPLLTALGATSAGSNGSIKQVMLDLVRNPAFRTHVGGAP